jgi:hypothetical protein
VTLAYLAPVAGVVVRLAPVAAARLGWRLPLAAPALAGLPVIGARWMG